MKKKTTKQQHSKANKIHRTPRTDLIHDFSIKEQKDCLKQQKSQMKYHTKFLKCW